MLSNEKRYVNTNMNSNLKHTIGSNDAQILISEEEPRNFLHVRLQRYFGQMFCGSNKLKNSTKIGMVGSYALLQSAPRADKLTTANAPGITSSTTTHASLHLFLGLITRLGEIIPSRECQ